MSRVASAQRFTAAHPCPVCGGYDGLPRGESARCAGFRSDDGCWAHCTREEHAGGLRLHVTSRTYAHRLDVPCRCDRAHDAAPRPHAARPASNGHAPAARRGALVATYDYRALDGHVAHRTLRYDPKDFRQGRPDPDRPGAWLPNLDGVDLVLYRLPEIQGQADVVVVEGEKDADALAALGIAVSCNAMGAGKWRAEYAQQLVDAGAQRVAVLPDNDRVGQDHAAAVAASCTAAGLCARLVALPGLPPVRERHGEDVSDWLAQGHPADELRAVLAAGPPAPDDPAALGLVVTRLADVAPVAVAWLWPSRVARGKLTVLAGDPGLGKSFVTLDMAARISTGQLWPDGAPSVQGAVILLSAEDGPADTIRPRVDALGGDPARIHLVQAIRDADGERAVSLDRDLPVLERAIATLRPVLVVIDPLTAYLGTTDSYKDADVRRLLAPLARLADQYHVAALSVMHLTKNSQTRAIYRTGGSIGFVGAARGLLLVAPDPEDEARRILVAKKNNLTAPPPALAYRITEDPPGTPARVVWDPEPVAEGLDADALLAGSGEDPAERQDADALLRDLLADGERPAAEALKAARANGVAERTLYRARRRLGVKARHAGQPGKSGGAWYWYFPEPEFAPPKAATTPPKAAISTNVAAFGEAGERTDETARTSPKAATSSDMAAFGGSLRADGSLPPASPAPGDERL